MMKKNFLKCVFMAMLTSVAMNVFAEDAPVYDVDSYPSQFESQPESNAQTSAAPETALSGNEVASDAGTAEYAPPPPPTENMTVEQRLTRMEQQLNNALHSDSTAKINEMQTQVQTLQGKIEELTHQIQQLQTQQKTMYSDLDKRINRSGKDPVIAVDDEADTLGADVPKLKSKTKPTAADTTLAETHTQPNIVEEQQIYQNAYNLIKAKKYNEAAATFKKMLQKYPSGQFAANAHYWLGELYGLMGKNDLAITEFNTVVKDFATSNKVADAQLKLGLLYAANENWDEAKTTLKKVVTQYPGTTSARLASEQLKQIKSTGH